MHFSFHGIGARGQGPGAVVLTNVALIVFALLVPLGFELQFRGALEAFVQ